MRIDVHTHIFPPEIVRERERFFDADPSFRLLYGSPKARLADAETLLEAMDRYGIERSMVFGFPWLDGELAARHNDYVLESASGSAQRLIPLGCMNPLAAGSPEEAERCFKAGVRGLGELAVYGPCGPGEALEGYRPLVDCCRSHGGILLVHANEPVGHPYPGKTALGVDFYYDLARMSAGIPLVLAHWGGGLCFYELLKKEAREVLANVYYDTAASPFLYRPDIYRYATDMLGAGKILFGSDFPLLPPGRYFEEMKAAGLDAEETDAIGGGNAGRLFSRLGVLKGVLSDRPARKRGCAKCRVKSLPASSTAVRGLAGTSSADGSRRCPCPCVSAQNRAGRVPDPQPSRVIPRRQAGIVRVGISTTVGNLLGVLRLCRRDAAGSLIIGDHPAPEAFSAPDARAQAFELGRFGCDPRTN